VALSRSIKQKAVGENHNGAREKNNALLALVLNRDDVCILNMTIVAEYKMLYWLLAPLTTNENNQRPSVYATRLLVLLKGITILFA
jgi:hypothetical protein